MAKKKYAPWSVVVDAQTAQAGTPVYLHGVQDYSLASGLQTIRSKGVESVYRTHGSIQSGAPAGRFSTNQLKAVLDIADLEGQLIDAGVDGDGLVLYEQQRKIGGTFQAPDSSLHVKRTIPNGIFLPRAISAPQNEDATIACEVVAIKNGATDPIAFDEAADLPAAIYPSVSDVWVMHSLDLNSTDLDGLQSVNADLGNAPVTDRFDSEIWPEHVSIEDINPSINAVTRHVDLTSILTETGLGFAADEVIFYLQHRLEGGTYVVPATATHIKVTMGPSIVTWEDIAGDPLNMRVMISPWYVAGETPTAPMTFATTSAIV